MPDLLVVAEADHLHCAGSGCFAAGVVHPTLTLGGLACRFVAVVLQERWELLQDQVLGNTNESMSIGP